jgi:hypothetical protein
MTAVATLNDEKSLGPRLRPITRPHRVFLPYSVTCCFFPSTSPKKRTAQPSSPASRITSSDTIHCNAHCTPRIYDIRLLFGDVEVTVELRGANRASHVVWKNRCQHCSLAGNLFCCHHPNCQSAYHLGWFEKPISVRVRCGSRPADG